MVNMAVQYKLAMADWSGTSKPPRSIKLLCFLLRSSLAALLLTPCLSGAPIDSAHVPEGCFLLAICARAKLRSLYPISAVSEPSSGIVCGNGLECFGDGLIQSFLAASFGGTEELFELRPSLLDGVQVGRVGR